ncbi:FtsX-like permease family protein [Streptomyces sp. enrichment culture]|uniref:FtsX-like permease family protein n=1 Tax=Streptomyces sp. enrichment culture TaxID=1795815 RepID=UPI003F5695EF
MSGAGALRPGTLVRLAFAATRTDTLRVVLTALSTLLGTLALLAALTVAAVPTPHDPAAGAWAVNSRYTSQLLSDPGLRPGVCLALALLTLPVLALAGQCARVGAPARDRRLATLRLAGATPRQTVAVIAAETGAAALLGTLAGHAAYFLLRAALHRPDADGRLPLPTDVLPHPAALAAVLLGVPLLSAAAAVLPARHLVTDPLGTVRRARTHAPRPWPAVLLAASVAAFTAVTVLSHAAPDAEDAVLPQGGLPLLLLLAGGVCGVLGIVLGTAWLSHTTGRLLHRYARRAPALLAARRLTADPWHGSRTLAAFLACVLTGAGAAAVRAYFQAMWDAEAAVREYVRKGSGGRTAGAAPDPFYLDAMTLVDAAVITALVIAAGGLLVTLAEAVTARRRAHAALTAGGVPRGVLVRAALWQTLAPALPALVLSLVFGTVLGRLVMGTRAVSGSYEEQVCTAPDGCPGDELTRANSEVFTVPETVRTAHVPWAELALYGGGALVLLLAAAGAALLLLRPATRVEELRAG